MSEIDLNKAPAGATHYRADSASPWRMLEDGEWYAWESDEENWISIVDPQPDRYLPIGNGTFAWGGTGLPPVGTVCELRTRRAENDPSGWNKAEIMYSSGTAVVWRWHLHRAEFGSEWCNVEFRPIRTLEQIAAEEREKAIQEIDHLINEQMGNLNVRELAEAIHDAGFRKVEGDKLC